MTIINYVLLAVIAGSLYTAIGLASWMDFSTSERARRLASRGASAGIPISLVAVGVLASLVLAELPKSSDPNEAKVLAVLLAVAFVGLIGSLVASAVKANRPAR